MKQDKKLTKAQEKRLMEELGCGNSHTGCMCLGGISNLHPVKQFLADELSRQEKKFAEVLHKNLVSQKKRHEAWYKEDLSRQKKEIIEELEKVDWKLHEHKCKENLFREGHNFGIDQAIKTIKKI